jgi:hypothetical protein
MYSALMTAGEGCWESGGPDWLFGVGLGCGIGALVGFTAWISLLVQSGTPYRTSQNERWWRLPSLAIGMWGVWSVLRDVVDNGFPVDVYLPVWGSLAVPVTASILMSRRARAAGVWPPLRTAPWGLWWLVPTVAALNLVVCVSSFSAMILAGQPCDPSTS